MSVEAWHTATKLLTSRIITAWYKVRYDYIGTEKKMKAPYLILGNHTTVLDAFFVSFGLKESIRYITSDQYFRNKYVAYLASRAGCIPKAKFVSDISVIRELIHCKNAGKSVGIFPEGYRNWDGFTDKLLSGTEKLVKLLNIPVVSVTSQGGYLSMPRWAKHRRKGPITLTYRLILTPEQIEKASVGQIRTILENEMAHDDNEMQRTHPIPYRGKRLAEELELILYCCPHCGAFETMVSDHDQLRCNSCGYTTAYNRFGFFTPVGDHPVYYDTPHKWREFCKQSIIRYLADAEKGSVLFCRDIDLYMESGTRTKFKKADSGTVCLYHDRFDFQGQQRDLRFPLGDLKGFTMSKRNMIDFYYQDVKYRFAPVCERTSSSLWENAYSALIH